MSVSGRRLLSTITLTNRVTARRGIKKLKDGLKTAIVKKRCCPGGHDENAGVPNP